jgi:hypothetical protein
MDRLPSKRIKETCLAFYEEDTNNLVTFHTDSYQEVTGHVCLGIQINGPTFAQVFRWFSDKYKLHSYISLGNLHKNSFGKHLKDYKDGEEVEVQLASEGCPYNYTSRCTSGRCDCDTKLYAIVKK